MPRTIRTKVQVPDSFVTIDASTQSMAFAVVEKGVVVEYGKLKYSGSTLDDKLKDIAEKTHAFFTVYPCKTIVIEDTIFINSRQTVTTLSKCHGALLAAAYLAGVEHSYRVSPIAWQSHIGTRLLTKEEKAKLKAQNPGKTAAWYKSRERAMRKARTIETVNKRFGFNIKDDDVADACGLAMFSTDEWKKVAAYAKK